MLWLLWGCQEDTKASVIPSDPPVLPEDCSALPAQSGALEVSPGDDIATVVANAAEGSTILFADGNYTLDAPLQITTPGLSLRAMYGEPSAVILDGLYASESLITIAASDVTVAELSLTRSYGPAIVVQGGTADTQNVHLYRLIIRDAGEEGIRVAPNAGFYSDTGVIGCTEVLRTESGRQDPSARCAGGVDMVAARGWRLYNNAIHGFWCDNSDPLWALSFRDGSADTVVERSRIYDNAGSLAFGDFDGPGNDPRPYDAGSCAQADTEHIGGIVRNNIIGLSDGVGAGYIRGLTVAESCGLAVVHNTFWSANIPNLPIETFGATIEAQFSNNLLSSEASDVTGLSFSNNAVATETMFVDAATGDLHLVEGSPAIDAGQALSGLCDEDMDRQVRDTLPDQGADEF